MKILYFKYSIKKEKIIDQKSFDKIRLTIYYKYVERVCVRFEFRLIAIIRRSLSIASINVYVHLFYEMHLLYEMWSCDFMIIIKSKLHLAIIAITTIPNLRPFLV